MSALVPRSRGRASRAAAVPSELEAAVIEAVRADVAERSEEAAYGDQSRRLRSQESIAQELHTASRTFSLSWIRRLVAKQRAVLERELAGGASGFGRRIVVDSAALPLPLLPPGASGAPDGELQIHWSVVAVVWDEGTRRILGHAIARAPATIWLHAEASAAASRTLEGMVVMGSKNEIPKIVTTLPHGDAIEALRLLEAFQAAGALGVHSARAPGSELMRMSGGRIGQLDLRPRFATDTFEGRISRKEALFRFGRMPMTLTDAELVLRHELERWNVDVADPVVEAAVAPGEAAKALTEAFRALDAFDAPQARRF